LKRLRQEEVAENQAIHAAKMPLGLLAIIYGIALVYMISFYTIPVQLPFYLQKLNVQNYMHRNTPQK
jgi:hypothetical protein